MLIRLQMGLELTLEEGSRGCIQDSAAPPGPQPEVGAAGALLHPHRPKHEVSSPASPRSLCPQEQGTPGALEQDPSQDPPQDPSENLTAL